MLAHVVIPHLNRHFTVAKNIHGLHYAWSSCGQNRVVAAPILDRYWATAFTLVNHVYIMLQIVTLSISPVILADKIVPIFCTLLYATAVSFSAEWSADQGNIQLMNVITSDNGNNFNYDFVPIISKTIPVYISLSL